MGNLMSALRVHTRMHAHTHTHTYVRHAHTHTHTYTHIHTHTHTHTHFVQTFRGEGQYWLLEIFGDEKVVCLFLKEERVAEVFDVWGRLIQSESHESAKRCSLSRSVSDEERREQEGM